MYRKAILTLILLAGCLFSLSGQTRLSLRFSPLLTTNRIDFSTDTLTATNDGVLPKLSLGLIADIGLTETYSFSTGLVYMPKGLSLRTAGRNGGAYNVAEEYRLQYLQVPVTFKLYTNEIQPDFKLYFQVGGALEVLLHDEPVEDNAEIITDFNFFDASVVLGAGTEYKLGASTILYGGITYYRGLLNVINTTIGLADNLEARNTVVGLDLGIKF